MSDELYVPKPGGHTRLDNTRGFMPPHEPNPFNKLEHERRLRRDLRKRRLSKDQIASLGDGAYVSVPKWWETVMVVKAACVTEYWCKDHREAEPEVKRECAICLLNAKLRRECAQISFQPHPQVSTFNVGKTHVWYPRIWWGVDEMTDDEIKQKRPDASPDSEGTFAGLVMAGANNKRLVESMLISLGRDAMLQEKTKLDCFARVKWEALCEPGLNVVKVQLIREPQGEQTSTDPVDFAKAS